MVLSRLVKTTPWLPVLINYLTTYFIAFQCLGAGAKANFASMETAAEIFGLVFVGRKGETPALRGRKRIPFCFVHARLIVVVFRTSRVLVKVLMMSVWH